MILVIMVVPAPSVEGGRGMVEGERVERGPTGIESCMREPGAFLQDGLSPRIRGHPLGKRRLMGEALPKRIFEKFLLGRLEGMSYSIRLSKVAAQVTR